MLGKPFDYSEFYLGWQNIQKECEILVKWANSEQSMNKDQSNS